MTCKPRYLLLENTCNGISPEFLVVVGVPLYAVASDKNEKKTTLLSSNLIMVKEYMHSVACT
jgi:hypothetical protein